MSFPYAKYKVSTLVSEACAWLGSGMAGMMGGKESLMSQKLERGGGSWESWESSGLGDCPGVGGG